MKYLYECRKHGEVELDHRITDDRNKQRCPVVATKGAHVDKICGRKLKPLIALGSHSKDAPAVFKGYHWPRHSMPQYKVERVKNTQTDDQGRPLPELTRDKVAVR